MENSKLIFNNSGINPEMIKVFNSTLGDTYENIEVILDWYRLRRAEYLKQRHPLLRCFYSKYKREIETCEYVLLSLEQANSAIHMLLYD